MVSVQPPTNDSARGVCQSRDAAGRLNGTRRLSMTVCWVLVMLGSSGFRLIRLGDFTSQRGTSTGTTVGRAMRSCGLSSMLL